MERIKLMAEDAGQWVLRAVFEPGPVKSPTIGISGLVISAVQIKEAAQWVVAVGTAVIVACHLFYYLVSIGCPLRRGLVKECERCRLCGSVLCPRKLDEKGMK